MCPGTSVAVCSLCLGMALASLAVARIITPVEVLTESCLASTVWVLKENRLWDSVGDWEQGFKAYVWGCGMQEVLDSAM